MKVVKETIDKGRLGESDSATTAVTLDSDADTETGRAQVIDLPKRAHLCFEGGNGLLMRACSNCSAPEKAVGAYAAKCSLRVGCRPQ